MLPNHKLKLSPVCLELEVVVNGTAIRSAPKSFTILVFTHELLGLWEICICSQNLEPLSDVSSKTRLARAQSVIGIEPSSLGGVAAQCVA